MEFQFGTNWATFSEKAGGVVGQPLAMEGLYAFMLESVFLGVLLYGRGLVPRQLHVASAILVWLGSWLSGFFIIATDAWMQHPVGYALDAAGRYEIQNLAAVLLSPWAAWQFAHVMTGAMIAGSLIVAGVGALYLLSRSHAAFGERFLRTGIVCGFVFSMLAIFPTGDLNAANVTRYQPIKLAAMEGLFESQHGAPMAIIGMPDETNRRLIDPIFVPDALSYLAYGNFRANVHGLSAYAAELWPPVSLTYYAYHVMVGLGTIFAAVTAFSVLLLWRKKLSGARWLLWIILLISPFPYIANEAGWTVTEVGRQPWIIYGLMKTGEAYSANVASGETVFTIIGFMGLYLVLGLVCVYLVLREIGIGPDGPVAGSTQA
jgi:cytochrome d ubiquinol oxidase subunit I